MMTSAFIKRVWRSFWAMPFDQNVGVLANSKEKCWKCMLVLSLIVMGCQGDSLWQVPRALENRRLLGLQDSKSSFFPIALQSLCLPKPTRCQRGNLIQFWRTEDTPNINVLMDIAHMSMVIPSYRHTHPNCPSCISVLTHQKTIPKAWSKHV